MPVLVVRDTTLEAILCLKKSNTIELSISSDL